MSSSNIQSGYIREFLGMFFANTLFIKRIFIGFAVISFLVPLALTDTFTVTGEIIVLSKKIQQGPQGALAQSSARYIPVSLSDMETENNIIRSIPLIRSSVAALYKKGVFTEEVSFIDEWINEWISLPIEKHITAPLRSMMSESESDPHGDAIDQYTDMVLSSLTIATIPGSNVISLSYESEDPVIAQIIVNELMDQYLIKRHELLLNDAPNEFLLQKKKSYRKRLNELEQQKLVLFNDNNVSHPREELSLTLGNINAERRALDQLQDKHLENTQWLIYLEEQLASLKKADVTKSTFPFSFGGSSGTGRDVYIDTEMKEESREIARLHSEYANARLSFRVDSPKVTKLIRRIKLQKERLITLIQNRITERYKALQVIESLSTSKLERIRRFGDRTRVLKTVAAAESELSTELEAVNDAYFKYSQQYEEKRSEEFSDMDQLTNVRILTRPIVPKQPSSPKPLLVVLIGLVAGLLVSITLGLLKEFFDHRFKFPDQIEEQLGIPLIACFDDMDVVEDIEPFEWSVNGIVKWLMN